ncbi:MAG: ORF6N domain-containing protein [Ruminococcus sp.]|nr:ORF6N domain-containing protein [Ruminococcus sp.]
MDEIITINKRDLSVKEYDGQRVVTFKDIDTIHNRPEGTASRNFKTNRNHFIEGEDFYIVKPSDIQKDEIRLSEINNRGTTFITESGYLMLVKSFTDDLAWDVQRDLVNKYFRAKAIKSTFSDLSPQLQLLIGMEIKQKEIEAKQQEQETAIANTNQRIDAIRDVVSLNSETWREDCRRIIAQIANKSGWGCIGIGAVYNEAYSIIDFRAGCNLERQLNNARKRMRENGASNTKINALSKIDIIARDKKLTEIYIAVVKDMAIKYGVCE